MVNDFQNIFYSYKVVQTIKDKINDYQSIKANNELSEKFNTLHEINNINLQNVSYKYPNNYKKLLIILATTFKKVKFMEFLENQVQEKQH